MMRWIMRAGGGGWGGGGGIGGLVRNLSVDARALLQFARIPVGSAAERGMEVYDQNVTIIGSGKPVPSLT
jgi:hypothetical protein